MTGASSGELRATDCDVAIVGAGLSGGSMAAHLQEQCPDLTFTLFERRGALGGTWDLFRYPGVRSDSDMHTLGFAFAPWTDDEAIAGAPAILRYLNRVVDERGLRNRIRFETRVISANWDDAAAHWQMIVESRAGGQERVTARFLYLGSGYYDHDKPHHAEIPGLEQFRGEVVHPQFWPQDLDYTNKRVVVIGSGATAVTLVPAMAATAASVVMLQRTPTWLGILPARDRVANFMRKALGPRRAYALTRWKNIHLHDWLFRRFRSAPDKARRLLTRRLVAALGSHYSSADYTPPYDPWDQRLCVVPDQDLFEAIKAGRAKVVTDRIESVEPAGIALQSGQHLPADVIVTATGLRMAIGGGIRLCLNGEPLDLSKRWFYRNCLLSNVPNLALVFGYLNASWTLRADLVATYVCRLLTKMRGDGATAVMPVMARGDEPEPATLFEMNSGYIERGRHLMPRSAAEGPWRLGQNYLDDRKEMRSASLDDGILQFRRAEFAEKLLEAAE